MREFQFKSTVEKMKINGSEYGIDFSDEKIREYQKLFDEFYDRSEEIRNVDVDKLTKEEEEKYFEESMELTKKVLDSLLGKGSYDKLYNESGKSLINMIDLITFLAEVINEKASIAREDRMDKYLKNKQNKLKKKK